MVTIGHSTVYDQPAASAFPGGTGASGADAVAGDSGAGLALIVRPLLRLIQHLTGMETSFVTTIDWHVQRQEVLFSLNSGELQVPEGGQVDWSESMCRSMFLSGRAHSRAVGVEVPATPDAQAQGIRAFVVVPVLVGDRPIGTVCAASKRDVAIDESRVASLQLIAEAMQQLLQIDQARHEAETRARQAGAAARQAQAECQQHASDAENMRLLAHSDALTGLPNRRAFTARWEEDLARSGRRNYPIALLLIDADRFKSINDALGHLVGDLVLQAIGEAVRAVMTSASLAARLGGDEFAFSVSHATDLDLFATAAEIRRVFALATARLGVEATLSIGIASSEHCPRHQLFARADSALYRSKAGGGDRAELFKADALPGVTTATTAAATTTTTTATVTTAAAGYPARQDPRR